MAGGQRKNIPRNRRYGSKAPFTLPQEARSVYPQLRTLGATETQLERHSIPLPQPHLLRRDRRAGGVTRLGALVLGKVRVIGRAGVGPGWESGELDGAVDSLAGLPRPRATLELIRAMAGLKPERVVHLDAGFKNNDQINANAVLTFESKGVAKFMTV